VKIASYNMLYHLIKYRTSFLPDERSMRYNVAEYSQIGCSSHSGTKRLGYGFSDLYPILESALSI
jgi:hypothetical protein